MNSEELAIIAAIIRNQRVAALGTLRDELPFTSMVAYAAEPNFGASGVLTLMTVVNVNHSHRIPIKTVSRETILTHPRL